MLLGHGTGLRQGAGSQTTRKRGILNALLEVEKGMTLGSIQELNTGPGEENFIVPKSHVLTAAGHRRSPRAADPLDFGCRSALAS